MRSAEYIRTRYGVPAKKGGKVIFNGRPGVITGYRDAYLLIRLDGEKHSMPCHPMWRIEYLTNRESVQ